MSRILAHRSGQLVGVVDVPGAKNSVLKLMVASLSRVGRTSADERPEISDVDAMAVLLGSLGVDVRFAAPGSHGDSCCPTLVRWPRWLLPTRWGASASINLLGPLLACRGHVRLDMPGGDDFGSRPIDMHVAGLSAMGVSFEAGTTHLERSRPFAGSRRGTRLSVGRRHRKRDVCGCTRRRLTTIRHAAREPEVADLACLLVEMGARIDGIGTDVLRIECFPQCSHSDDARRRERPHSSSHVHGGNGGPEW